MDDALENKLKTTLKPETIILRPANANHPQF